MKKTICRLALALVPWFTGCHATSIMVGHREVNLVPVQQAQNRTQVEKILGEPVWHPGSAAGVTYEVYQFEAGRAARPVMGTMGLCLDAVTLGSMEALYGNHELLPTYKQVAVAYDTTNRVRFVSPSWPVSGPEPERRMISHLPNISGVPDEVKPHPLRHWTSTNETVAVLELPWYDRWEGIGMVQVKVDGKNTKGGVTSLTPGSHQVTFKLYYTAFTEIIEVLPRRVYRLNIERYSFSDWADVTSIEDVESREVLCCRETIPPRP